MWLIVIAHWLIKLSLFASRRVVIFLFSLYRYWLINDAGEIAGMVDAEKSFSFLVIM